MVEVTLAELANQLQTKQQVADEMLQALKLAVQTDSLIEEYTHVRAAIAHAERQKAQAPAPDGHHQAFERMLAALRNAEKHLTELCPNRYNAGESQTTLSAIRSAIACAEAQQ